MANSAEWTVVPLVAGVNQRYTDTSVDGLLTNGFLQKDSEGTIWVRRRAGFQELAGLVPDGTYSALGVFVPKTSSGVHYVGAHPDIFVAGISQFTFGFPPLTNQIWFDESTTTTVTNIYASNGEEGAYQSGTSLFTRIIDSNYPARTLNGSAYLNGFLYVMDLNGSIWGSTNQNDFSTWSSTNVINAWGTDGVPIAIRSYLNEVLAFKSFSVEVFYDAGNAIGSPLLPVQQINIRWGCFNPSTIVKIDAEIFWVGTSEASDVAVIRMAAFNPTPVSNDAVNRYLNFLNSSGVTVNGAYSCTMAGDRFYCVSTTNGLNNLTLAYNLTSGEWSVFSSSMYGNAVVQGSTSFGNVITPTGQVIQVNENIQYDINHTPGNATQKKYAISEHLRTGNFAAGTSLRKMVSGLRIQADQKSASSLRIRWSDDDYQTWSAWRNIDLSKNVPLLPGLQGTFAKRAYELEYAGRDPIRFSKLELLIALGDI